jgi:hypothetical protein
VAAAALLALALGAVAPALPSGGDPCTVTDARGRTFRTCFDRGNALEVSAGGAWGTHEPTRGGATDLRLGFRWRGDLRTPAGDLEWLRDMSFLDARLLLTAGGSNPRAGTALVWRGLFVHHRASPFLLVPGPNLRLPFPFDVGLLVEAGAVAWDASRPGEVLLAPLRAAFLLDLGGHGVLRRLAFGPEVAWTARVSEDEKAAHGLAPFTSGVIDGRAESADGLSAARLTVRGGSSLLVSGGSEGFLEARVAVERVVVAVNDVPVALYAEGAFLGGASGRGGELNAGLRAGFGR